jgi:hypothetical protein
VNARSTLLLAAALAAFLTFGVPARAAHIDLGASDLGGGSVATSDLGPGTLAFDPGFVSNAPMTLAIVLDAAETGAPLAWTALVDNLTGELWGAFRIEVLGAAIAQAGTVRGNASSASVSAGPAGAVVVFGDPGEAAGLDIGAFDVGEIDWLLDAGAAGSFTIVLQPLAVPEPTSAALLSLGVLGLASSALVRPRRR